MRLPCFFVLGLVALPSFALEYPDPPDAAAKAHLAVILNAAFPQTEPVLIGQALQAMAV